MDCRFQLAFNCVVNNGTVVPGTTITEFSTAPFKTLFGGKSTSLNLPIKETLDQPRDALTQWVNIRSFQTRMVGNDWGPAIQAAIQAAIESGKTTIYFPHGSYTINTTVQVNGTVHVFQGVGSILTAGADISRTRPMFRVESGNAPAVFFDFFSFEGGNENKIHIESASNRSVVVKHSRWLHYQSKPGAGDLFVDDAAGNLYYLDHPQKVFLRALNLEDGSRTNLFNNAADLVVLNHKTEGQGTSIVNGANGRTEILGGLNYPASGDPKLRPAYINNGGEMTVVQLQWWSQDTCVRETRSGQSGRLLRSETAGGYMFYTSNHTTASTTYRMPDFNEQNVAITRSATGLIVKTPASTTITDLRGRMLHRLSPGVNQIDARSMGSGLYVVPPRHLIRY